MRIGITVNEGIVVVETEDDGSLSLCNIAAQFPNVSGLKYLNKTTNFWRGIRRVKDSFFPPQRSGWGDVIYVVVLTPSGMLIFSFVGIKLASLTLLRFEFFCIYKEKN